MQVCKNSVDISEELDDLDLKILIFLQKQRTVIRKNNI